MTLSINAEASKNYHFFQGIVGSLMSKHAGGYALLRDCAVVGVYTKVGDALSAAGQQFDDGRFSVQKVIDRPRDLGFLSYGSDQRDAD